MKKEFLKIGKIGLFEVKLPILKIGQGRPRGLIISLQHGGENSSLLVIKEIIQEKRKLKGTAFILPVANPFGQIFNQRNELIEGKDLNRSFPGKKNGDFAARLAAAIFQLARKMDFVVDLHNFSRLSPVTVGFTKAKGENHEQIIKMIKNFKPELVWQVETDKGEDKRFKNTIDEALVKIGIPSFFVEIPNLLLINNEQIQRVKEGVLAVFERFFIKEKIDTKQRKVFSARYVYSDEAGIFEPLVKPFEKIKKGEILGLITTISEYREVKIKSPFSGVVLTIKPEEVVRTGTKISSIGVKQGVL